MSVHTFPVHFHDNYCFNSSYLWPSCGALVLWSNLASFVWRGHLWDRNIYGRNILCKMPAVRRGENALALESRLLHEWRYFPLTITLPRHVVIHTHKWLQQSSRNVRHNAITNTTPKIGGNLSEIASFVTQEIIKGSRKIHEARS